MSQVKNKLSPYGISLIQGFESLSLSPYRDSNHNWTIGWGHLLSVEPSPGLLWTREMADSAFFFDVKWAESVVNALGVELSGAQFDALVSLVFNIGSGHFSTSTVKEKLISGEMKSAADAFMLWDDHGTVKGRRALERAVFIYGTIK